MQQEGPADSKQTDSVPLRGSVKGGLQTGQVPEKPVGSQRRLGTAAPLGGGPAPVWSDQSPWVVRTISLTSLPTNNVSPSQKDLTGSCVVKQESALRVETPIGSLLMCKGPSGVRDPWNGRVIYADCVSRRGLAREWRVGRGPPPHKEVHLRTKGAPNTTCKKPPTVCSCITATALHLSAGQQEDRGEGNPERQSRRKQPQRGQDSRLNARGLGRKGGIKKWPTRGLQTVSSTWLAWALYLTDTCAPVSLLSSLLFPRSQFKDHLLQEAFPD